ncbi:MAG: trimeric intracellular cation channel family protein [Magnetovibrionaceae bacterium]
MNAVFGLDTLIGWLDLAGVIVFAASGALSAARKQSDIVGFILIATVVGIGGGTFRDLVLDQPVFWVAAPHYLYITTATAVVVFFLGQQLENRYRALVWADAIGLGVFAVIGVEKALAAGAGPMVAVLMAVITASLGGIIRDLLCQEVPLLLRPEIYVTAAAAGAGTYLLALDVVGLERWIAATAAFVVGFGLRGAALHFGLALPSYKSRPGRPHPPAPPA